MERISNELHSWSPLIMLLNGDICNRGENLSEEVLKDYNGNSSNHIVTQEELDAQVYFHKDTCILAYFKLRFLLTKMFFLFAFL